MKKKHIAIITISSLAIVVLVVWFLLGPGYKFYEFAKFEGVKGYWLPLSKFHQANERYPKDTKEYVDYLSYLSGEKIKEEDIDVIYIPPKDDDIDEVILWRKKRLLSGKYMGVTEEMYPVITNERENVEPAD